MATRKTVQDVIEDMFGPDRPERSVHTDWRTTVPALSSDRVLQISGKALLDPEALTLAELQELAAAVMAHLSRLSQAKKRKAPALQTH